MCSSFQSCEPDKRTSNFSKFVWIVSNNEFKILLSNSSTVNVKDISLIDHFGQKVEIKSIKQNGSELYISANLNLEKNYMVCINGKSQYGYFSREVLDRYFYSKEKLGVTYLRNSADVDVEFAVWSPPATDIVLQIYDGQQFLLEKPLQRDRAGVWKGKLSKDEIQGREFNGLFYNYKVTCLGQTNIVIDPYGKSMSAFNPAFPNNVKSAIVDLEKTDPFGFKDGKLSNSDILPTPLHFVGYEVHIRDFTIDPSLAISDQLKGTYLGMAENEVMNYFTQLGITHVQLQPIQSFYTVNEKDRSFQGDSIPSTNINFNWGYDPHSYFAPEGWYSTNSDDPSARIRELKEMVLSFHQNGLGVIVDVVYNHMYEAATLEQVAPGCYMRRNEDGKISIKTGAGVTVESRTKMVRRLIVDSLEYFQNEFHINGFRFDLMGFMDQETIKEIRKVLGNDVILYGEAWEFTDLPANQAVTKSNLPEGFEIGAFNDSSRDSYAGNMASKGFIQGAFFENAKAKTGIIGGIINYPIDYDGDGKKDVLISSDPYHLFAKNPVNTLNYLTIHDGFTLWDKINLSVDGDREERSRIVKMAFAMLFTSQGRIVLHGGCEMGRSKPLATNDPNPDRAHTSNLVNQENGISYFHENSYKSPDTTNMIDWGRAAEFSDLRNYLKGLISMRKHFSSMRYQKSSSVRRGIRFFGEEGNDLTDELVGPYSTFSELDFLKIEFVRGPVNERLYVVGEVYPEGVSKNPTVGRFFVDFDKAGNGSIKFSKNEIASFDLRAWSDPDNLQIKFVRKAGEWDSPAGFYSTTGNNTISAASVGVEFNAKINLSIMNHVAGKNGSVEVNGYIAYSLDNTLESDNACRYKKLFVIHNAYDFDKVLKVEEISNYSTCHVMLDNNRSGIIPIENSSVEIIDQIVLVPRKSSAIIACF